MTLTVFSPFGGMLLDIILYGITAMCRYMCSCPLVFPELSLIGGDLVPRRSQQEYLMEPGGAPQ